MPTFNAVWPTLWSIHKIIETVGQTENTEGGLGPVGLPEAGVCPVLQGVRALVLLRSVHQGPGAAHLKNKTLLYQLRQPNLG